MARRLLGQPVDIHGGGTDLIFPHHESEAAQAENLPGERPFVRHWVHTGTVHYEAEKMSKSLGNMVFVTDLLRRYPPAAIRAFLLRRHYRSDWEFREGDLAREAKDHARGLGVHGGGVGPDQATTGDPEAVRSELLAALDGDLDTPEAVRVLDRAAGSTDPAVRAVVDEGRALLGLDI
jgi:L-cysteine:1D-myo-inositol 2-amino-2-deoxy-alpha-D-glucopyranoside ligase